MDNHVYVLIEQSIRKEEAKITQLIQQPGNDLCLFCIDPENQNDAKLRDRFYQLTGEAERFIVAGSYKEHQTKGERFNELVLKYAEDLRVQQRLYKLVSV